MGGLFNLKGAGARIEINAGETLISRNPCCICFKSIQIYVHPIRMSRFFSTTYCLPGIVEYGQSPFVSIQ